MNTPHSGRVCCGRVIRAWIASAPAVVLAGLTAGCIFFAPVPTAYHAPGSRRNLTEETTKRFSPGLTTLKDVVLALGEPDEATQDASRLVYRWERVHMHMTWGWAIPAGEVGVGQGWQRTYSNEHSLIFEFDEQGVLRQIHTSRIKSRTTEEQQ